MKQNDLLDNEEFKQHLRNTYSYDPESGKIWHTLKKRECGSISGDGHLQIRVNVFGKTNYMKAHRIAWFLHYGDWPKSQLDHINRIVSDNRISNLRIATNQNNAANRCKIPNCSSKYKGVSCYKRYKKWVAKLMFKYRRIHLGYFDNEIDAARAYDAKALELFGEFAVLNFPTSENVQLPNEG